MNYNEIKAKYSTASATRIAQRTTIRNEYDQARRRVEDIEAKLEGLRPKNGIMTAEDSQNRDNLMFEKNEAMRELRKAQINLQEFDASDIDIPNVADSITH